VRPRVSAPSIVPSKGPSFVLLPDTVLMINMVIIKLALEVKQVQKSFLLNVEAGVKKSQGFWPNSRGLWISS
jgi:hypothetical protein